MKKIIAIILNSALIITETYALFLVIKENGLMCFKFYTDLSNFLALFSSVVYVINSITSNKISNFTKYLKLFAVTNLSVTFFVVIFILAPVSGTMAIWFMLFFDSMFFHHLFCPVLSIVSFLFFETDISLLKSDIFVSIIPTLIYAGIILALNLAKIIVGPYKFFLVFEQPYFITILYFIIILLLILTLSSIFFLIKKRQPKPSLNKS